MLERIRKIHRDISIAALEGNDELADKLYLEVSAMEREWRSSTKGKKLHFVVEDGFSADGYIIGENEMTYVVELDRDSVSMCYPNSHINSCLNVRVPKAAVSVSFV